MEKELNKNHISLINPRNCVLLQLPESQKLAFMITLCCAIKDEKLSPEHPMKILFPLSLASVPTSLGKYWVLNPFSNKVTGLGKFKEYQIHREQTGVHISNTHLQKSHIWAVASGNVANFSDTGLISSCLVVHTCSRACALQILLLVSSWFSNQLLLCLLVFCLDPQQVCHDKQEYDKVPRPKRTWITMKSKWQVSTYVMYLLYWSLNDNSGHAPWLRTGLWLPSHRG